MAIELCVRNLYISIASSKSNVAKSKELSIGDKCIFTSTPYIFPSSLFTHTPNATNLKWRMHDDLDMFGDKHWTRLKSCRATKVFTEAQLYACGS